MDFTTQTYALIDQYAIPFTYSSTTKNGVKTIERRNIINALYGRETKYNFSLLCKYSDFTTIPTDKEFITLNGTEYKIIGVQIDALNITVKLDIGDIYA